MQRKLSLKDRPRVPRENIGNLRRERNRLGYQRFAPTLKKSRSGTVRRNSQSRAQRSIIRDQPVAEIKRYLLSQKTKRTETKRLTWLIVSSAVRLFGTAFK